MRITDSLFPYSFQINAAVVAENYVRNQSDYDCPFCVSLSIRDYGYDGDVEVGSAILSTKELWIRTLLLLVAPRDRLRLGAARAP